MVKENFDRKPKEFFESELDRITDIHFEAKYYFKDIEYIIKPSTEEEEKIASNDPFIQRLIKAFWRLGIIEISKLYQENRNQHYNLINYLEELIKYYDEYNWIKDLSKNKLQEWLELINSNEFSTIREKVKVQRDNYFAHSDRSPKKELKDVPILLIEINKLIELTEDILFELYSNCLGTECEFEVLGMEKSGHILEAYIALKEKSEMKRKEIVNKHMKENEIKNILNE